MKAKIIVRYWMQIGVFVAIFAACLFIAAGRLDWPAGWIYLGLVVLSQAGAGLILMVSNPALIEARGEIGGKRDLDRRLAGIMALVGPVLICLAAGLNLRFGWPPRIAMGLQMAGVILAALGALLTVWAMAANKFFYGVARIASERGHTVCRGGPYRWVRHPGYLGAMLFDLGAPLALQSAWAFLPALLTVGAICLRTALEDKMLQAGLAGYANYARQVRYRLLPGLW